MAGQDRQDPGRDGVTPGVQPEKARPACRAFLACVLHTKQEPRRAGAANLAGQIFKIVSYRFIYPAVFIESVPQPFTALYRALTKETRRATEQHALVRTLDMPAGKPAVST